LLLVIRFHHLYTKKIRNLHLVVGRGFVVL
jgi:hypothetical protein